MRQELTIDFGFGDRGQQRNRFGQTGILGQIINREPGHNKERKQLNDRLKRYCSHNTGVTLATIEPARSE